VIYNQLEILTPDRTDFEGNLPSAPEVFLCKTFLRNGSHDLQPLLLHLRQCVVGVQTLQDFHRFFETVMGKKPAWGLWEECNDADSRESEEDLQSNGASPLGRVVNEAEAVVHPVSHRHATHVGGELRRYQTASRLCLHELGMPDGYTRGDDTIASARDDAADLCSTVSTAEVVRIQGIASAYHELSDRESGALNDRPNGKDARADHDGPLATQSLTNQHRQQGTGPAA